MRTRLANVMSCSTFEVVHVRDSLKERNARHCATLCKSECWRVLPDRSEGGEDCGLAVRCYRFPLWAIFHSSLWSLTSCSGLLRFPCSLPSLKNLMAIRKLSVMLKRTTLLSLKLYICLYNRRYNRWLWKLTAVSRGLRCDISEIKSTRTRDETQLKNHFLWPDLWLICSFLYHFLLLFRLPQGSRHFGSASVSGRSHFIPGLGGSAYLEAAGYHPRQTGVCQIWGRTRSRQVGNSKWTDSEVVNWETASAAFV